MRGCFRSVAVIGLTLAIALPSSATPPPEMPAASERELYCIANGLSAANKLSDVGDALYRSGNRDKAQAALDAATSACRTQHGWTDSQTGLAQMIASYVAIKEEAAEDIYAIYQSEDDNATDMALNTLQPIADELPDSTEATLVQGGQLHPDVISRLRDMFNEAGQPGYDSFYFPTAMTWMQANAAENAVRKRWVSEPN